MIAITSDIDWAPEEVIYDMVQIFESYGIKCTFFCTHYSKCLESADKNLFELAIHPNFNPLLNGYSSSVEKILEDILNIYPNSKGVRSHSMLQSSGLLNLFSERGLIYESNYFLPYYKNVQPILLWNNMLRLPYIWEDDVHWLYNRSFEKMDIDLQAKGLKIFNFHPIHIFLNTLGQKHYLQAKEFYHNPEKLLDFRNNGQIKGTRDALIHLLDYLKTNQENTYTLYEITTNFFTNSIQDESQ